MAVLLANNLDWIEKVHEDVVDPDQRIVDCHHHLGFSADGGRYLVEELHRDTAGHKVEKTVFIECQTHYRKDGPDHLKAVGEAEFVVRQIEQSKTASPGKPTVAAYIGRIDFHLAGTHEEALDALEEAGKGYLRGIRSNGAYTPHTDAIGNPYHGVENFYERDDVRAGIAAIGKRGMLFDGWHYHPQNKQYADLAKANPNMTFVLDHLGSPLGVGPYAAQKEEIYAAWKKDMKALSELDNVICKLGGLGMPDIGFGFDRAELPPTSDQVAEAFRGHVLHAIDCFGPDRCMFESNFPMDRHSMSYRVLWNAFKKIAAGFSADEKDRLFYRTAERVYGMAV